MGTVIHSDSIVSCGDTVLLGALGAERNPLHAISIGNNMNAIKFLIPIFMFVFNNLPSLN
jgi:hypothetical protein